MSEMFPGMPAAAPPAKTRDAAAVVLYRKVGAQVEVYWVKREARLSFAGGFYAFPGGRVDASDALIPVRGATGLAAALRVAAARELLEETGVLVARGAERLNPPQLAAARKALLDRARGFAAILSEHGLSLDADDFVEAGRWITPSFMPSRFDARFFLAEAPAHSKAEHWPGELSEGAWVKPAEALTRWDRGTALLHPPNLLALQTMAAFSTKEAAAGLLNAPVHAPGFIASRIEFQRGIRLFPLETPTLPPATHTNAYILGNGELLVVDPGAAEVRQYARLLALMAGLIAEGKRAKAVFLTHHHADHIGGALAVKQRLKVPVWCHERTADRLPFKADRVLADGEVITLAGAPSMTFDVLHTPGHARGHLCLVDRDTRAAIVGDMVAGLGTIVIDPPEGDMSDYLTQLQRLRDLPVGTLYPAHGPASPDGPAKLNEYLQHRAQREQRVVEAIALDGSLLKDIVAKAYADVPEVIHPLAERSAQAILIKLVRDGKAARKDDRYWLA